MRMKSLRPILLVIAGATCIPFAAFAGATDVGVPIDGGLTLLVAAGIGYGIKKAHDKRKKDKASAQKQN